MLSDLNLLFGVMAYQTGFISKEQFFQAVRMWVDEKDASLGEILVDTKAITPSERSELDELVARKLSRCSNDVAESLKSAAATHAFCRDLTDETQDSDIARSVSNLLSDDADLTGTLPLSEAASSDQRFQLLRPLGAGGLGKVTVAIDQELHREVAVKEILSHCADREEYRNRFLFEAEVTGGLEHPGIVPVYSMSFGTNGRPYYAMRLIRGRDLRSVIKEFHKSADDRESMLALHKLLARFIAACHAIHYAHTRGVVHRDLTPGNIMVGDHGETLVIDWGLAALSKHNDHAQQNRLNPPSADRLPPEQPGRSCGTPAYMSPEQAVGDTKRIGVQTDIYGLGAILYHILTGEKPIRADKSRDAVLQAEKGEFPRPREIQPRIPKPLEAICLKAMAHNPDQRYPATADLAEDVQRWLADESVQAYPESMRERAARWLRRNRSAALTGLTGLAAVALVSTAAAFFINASRHQAVLAKNAAQEARKQESIERDRAVSAEAVALKNKSLAIEKFRQARAAVDRWTTGPAAALDGYPVVRAYQQKLLRAAVEDYRELAIDDSQDPEIQLERARTILRMAEFEYQLAGMPRNGQTLEKAKEGFEQAAEILDGLKNRSQFEIVREQANAKLGIGKIVFQLGELRQAKTYFEDATSLVTEVISSLTAADLYAARMLLAACYEHQGQTCIALSETQSAEMVLRRSLDAYDAAFSAGSPITENEVEDYSQTLRKLAQVLNDRGEFRASREHCEKAIRFTSELVEKHPQNVDYLLAAGKAQEVLAVLLRQRGQLNESRDIYVRILDRLLTIDAIANQYPSYLEAKARVHNQLGQALFRLGKTKDARPHFVDALETYSQLSAASPEVPRLKKMQAVVQDNLGQLLSELGDQQTAILHCENALLVFGKLSVDLETEELLALPAMGENANANLDVLRRYAIACSHAGLILQKLNNQDHAKLYFEEATKKLDAVSVHIPQAANDRAKVNMHIARFFQAIGKSEQSEAVVAEAIKIWERLLASNPSPEFIHDFAREVCLAGSKGKPYAQMVLVRTQRAVELAPQNADYAGTLSAAHFRAGDFNEAKTWLQKAKRLRGEGTAFEAFIEVMIYARENQTDKAQELLQKANELFEDCCSGNLALQDLKDEAKNYINE